MFDITKIKTAQECRNLMANAGKQNRPDVYKLAFRRLVQLEAKNQFTDEVNNDTLALQTWAAIGAVEELLREKHGKAVKANYTRRKLKEVGVVACLTDWALKKDETEGFKMLVAAGLGDQTGEYVVVSNATRFPDVVVQAARKKLTKHNVIIKN